MCENCGEQATVEVHNSPPAESKNHKMMMYLEKIMKYEMKVRSFKGLNKSMLRRRLDFFY